MRRTTSTTWDDLTISGKVSKATRPYFDRARGNWLPGDAAEVDDLTIRDAEGVDITGQLSDEDLEKFSGLLVERASEDEADAYADAMERRADADREERMLGDKS